MTGVDLSRSSDTLTKLSAAALARGIAENRFSAVEVVDAHIQRIENVNSKLNAVVLPRFEEARREAEAIDAARGDGLPLGPLGGVPITIKECFQVEGLPATIGVEGFGQGQLAERDGLPVARLRGAGAIVLGKTNVPQLMAMFETDNPTYGRTNNPWDLGRTPGGSSGGEAATVAAGGSPLGLVNDLGGSIRVPAHFCGIHGIKPTSGRLTNLGAVANFRGLTAMATQPGLLSRHVEDLSLGLHLLASDPACRIDPNAAPPSTIDPTDVKIERLRGAMWSDDGYFTPSPAIQRAVREAADALRDAGATIETIAPPDVHEAMRLYMQLFTADGGADLRRLLGGSRKDRRIARTLYTLKAPRPLRHVIATGLKLFGQPREAELLQSVGPHSADRHWQHSFRRHRFSVAFGERMAEGQFDFLLCPPFGLPAISHGTSADLIPAASYAMLFNLLGMPAGTVSVTRVREDEQSANRTGRAPSDRRARDVDAGSVGLPVGVQVAAPWWCESTVLSVMQSLQEAFATRGDYPVEPQLVD